MFLAVLVTCAISATALTFAYGATAERIEEQERLAREAALREVLTNGEAFDEVSEETLACLDEADSDTAIAGAYIAESASGDIIGLGVLAAPRGYGGPIQMVIGVDRDGKVTGVSIITHKETPGLGSKVITEEWFGEQFIGWDSSQVDESDQGFDAISGATKSSNGVRRGVRAAERAYLEWLECTGGGMAE